MKAQMSVEFLILFSLVLFSFLLLLGVSNFFGRTLDNKFRVERDKEIAKEIANSINRIFIGPNASSTTILLPQNYSFNYTGGAIIVTDEIGVVGSFFVFPKNITIVKNYGNITIRNVNGGIVVD
ncbi:MAG: hypothetical protein QXI58_06610 [Candidatus Micrarchaeia archaeon]